MIGKLTGLLLLSLAAVLHSTVAARAADPVSVQSLTVQGTGCPAGSVAMNISPDQSAFALLFDSYVAEAGPGLPANRRARDCIVHVLLKAPVGWSWAIVGVDHRGFASLQPGVSATIKSSFQFHRQTADQGQAPPLVTHLRGPMSEPYALSTDTPPLQIDWSACGGTSELHIKTRLEINVVRASDSGLLSLDSLDGQLTQLDGTTVCGYRVVWRRCN